MRFCQSFMTELYRHIGQFVDCPAGDIGVGGREVGYLFGQYKRLTNSFQGGMLTGKGLTFGGSLARTEATRLRPVLLHRRGPEVHARRRTASRADRGHLRFGNVAIYAQGRQQLGAGRDHVRLNGYVTDPNGIDLAYVKDLKKYAQLHQNCAETHAGATYVADCDKVRTVPCEHRPVLRAERDQQESAEALVKGGHCRVRGVTYPLAPRRPSGSTCPTASWRCPDRPGFNAGGVAALRPGDEPNSERLSWTFEEVDQAEGASCGRASSTLPTTLPSLPVPRAT